MGRDFRGRGKGRGGGRGDRSTISHHQHHHDRSNAPPPVSSSTNALPMSSSSSNVPSSFNAEARAGASVLMEYDHKQMRWWECLEQVKGSAVGNQKQKKQANHTNNNKGKRNRGKSGQQDEASKNGHHQQQRQELLKEDIQKGQTALAAAQALFESKRAKNLDQEMKWTEKVLRQGKPVFLN